MRCDEGRLMAWRDGALGADEAATVAAHVAGCADCQERAAEHARAGAVLGAAFDRLDPVVDDVPAVGAALARAQRAAQLPPRSWTERWIMSLRRMRSHPAWRPALVTGAVAMAVAVGLAFAPVREAAAQFLGLFRVNNFAVVPVSEERMAQLEGLDGIMESGLIGQTTTLRDPGERIGVDDAAAASAAAGFTVREPAVLPDGVRRTGYYAQAGPAIRLQYDRALAESMLAQAGITDVPLPAVDAATVTVDLPTAVVQTFGDDEGIGAQMQLFQMAEPTIDLPEDVDAAQFGEALLRLLGVPAGEAASLARTIDWTSTLVIPVPAAFAQFRALTVDGVPAVLVDGAAGRGPRERAVLWQRDGIIYGLTGRGLTDAALLGMADSLK